MKEGRPPLGEPQQSLRRRVNPAGETILYGLAALTEGMAAYNACHYFAHEHPIQGLINIFGASVFALAIMKRVNELSKKINTLTEHLPNQEQEQGK